MVKYFCELCGFDAKDTDELIAHIEKHTKKELKAYRKLNSGGYKDEI